MRSLCILSLFDVLVRTLQVPADSPSVITEHVGHGLCGKLFVCLWCWPRLRLHVEVNHVPILWIFRQNARSQFGIGDIVVSSWVFRLDLLREALNGVGHQRIPSGSGGAEKLGSFPRSLGLSTLDETPAWAAASSAPCQALRRCSTARLIICCICSGVSATPLR